MKQIDNLNLRFSGDKTDMKIQLQEWCLQSGRTMNGTVIELIQLLLEIRDLDEMKKRLQN